MARSDVLRRLELATARSYEVRLESAKVSFSGAFIFGTVTVNFGELLIRRCSFRFQVSSNTSIDAMLRSVLASLSSSVLEDLRAKANPGFFVSGKHEHPRTAASLVFLEPVVEIALHRPKRFVGRFRKTS